MKDKTKGTQGSKGGQGLNFHSEKHCPACGEKYKNKGHGKRKTKHHILPKRFFGGSGPTEAICRSCHDELERNWIPFEPKLTPAKYRKLFDKFIEYKKGGKA